ncbi:MAG: alpha/beta hydrolase family protein, partial [Gemmatimonadales bacterium]
MSSREDAALLLRGIAGTLVAPGTIMPGVLFVHGWGGSQEQYLARAREIAALGCICLTFNLRGHAQTDAQHETITREENLHDLIATYDVLTARPGVDPSTIAVIGSSYGGYLATILTSLRRVRWLGLRAPTLYMDDDWALPKMQLKKPELAAYRRHAVSPDEDQALAACAAFRWDVLIVESERDGVVPHRAIASYVAALESAHSMTDRVIEEADHRLSEEPWQQAYRSLLVKWVTEMVPGAR